MNYFSDALLKYGDFGSRTKRRDYWMFILFYLFLSSMARVLDLVLGFGLGLGLGFSLVSWFFSLATLIPLIAVTARRLHDMSRSGWWMLLGFVPLVGLIILIIFLSQKSQANNQYGESPE